MDFSSIKKTLSCFLPSRIIAKIAFQPPKSTYKIISDSHGKKLEIYQDPFWGTNVVRTFDITTIDTPKGSNIVCCHIKVDDPKVFTLFVSHGNAVDLGLIVESLQHMSSELNVNIFCYDYSGYGESTGECLEANMYVDAETAFKKLIDTMQTHPMDVTDPKDKTNLVETANPIDRIVLYGHSIGTAPTVHLATKYEVAGVVLHSPLTSGYNVAFPTITWKLPFDPFRNIEKVHKIKSRTLLIHGSEDSVIGFQHSVQLKEKLSNCVGLERFDGSGHNDIELDPKYFDILRSFLNTENPDSKKSSPE